MPCGGLQIQGVPAGHGSAFEQASDVQPRLCCAQGGAESVVDRRRKQRVPGGRNGPVGGRRGSDLSCVPVWSGAYRFTVHGSRQGCVKPRRQTCRLARCCVQSEPSRAAPRHQRGLGSKRSARHGERRNPEDSWNFPRKLRMAYCFCSLLPQTNRKARLRP